MSVARPGWAEILVGLLALGVVGILGGVLIARLPIGPVAIGLIFTALSGVAGMGALRPWSPASPPARSSAAAARCGPR